MSGTYNLKDLLNVAAQQGAAELRLEPNRPPMMLLHGMVRVLDGPVVTSDQIAELLHGIVTEEQRREFDVCGSVHFAYAADHSARFSVRAGMQGKNVCLNIINVGR